MTVYDFNFIMLVLNAFLVFFIVAITITRRDRKEVNKFNLKKSNRDFINKVENFKF